MKGYIRQQNIELFEQKLADPRTSEEERRIVLKLLAEERARNPFPSPLDQTNSN